MHDPSSIALALIVPKNILTFTQKRDKELQSQLTEKGGTRLSIDDSSCVCKAYVPFA